MIAVASTVTRSSQGRSWDIVPDQSKAGNGLEIEIGIIKEERQTDKQTDKKKERWKDFGKKRIEQGASV